MNKSEIETLIEAILHQIPDRLRGADKADFYVLLGEKLGMAHLLLPELRPSNPPELPQEAPEIFKARKDRRETIIDFIARVYEPWLGRGLARSHLWSLDRSAYYAVENWGRKKPVPDWFDLPTKQELNDRELDQLGVLKGEMLPYPSHSKDLREKIRLYNAARHRRNSGKDESNS
ncbi:MAG: hypothetical protein KJ731_16450 [Alphaproteobacteria bacterium]|nr:hypothetical protein [Alphaproteobacteria bacterium]MBU1278486.1 hypothetical protein [Alphaproteobacteria bacterium]MBU1573339.1 hypothetical protein [Alphaproteobacteria bacterium]MBU1830039.1 hypothetical protein [Alphaproteobacteria bacterium]MBU2241222.1 hypothetical protein [Alphaproteobacteria bacterium]